MIMSLRPIFTVTTVWNTGETGDINSSYSDKLSHVQVVINPWYSVAQMCTCEDALVYVSDAPSIDDVMSYNLLTTLDIQIIEQKKSEVNL